MNNKVKKILSIGFAGVLVSVSAVNVLAVKCVNCDSEALEGKGYCFSCEPICDCEGIGSPYEGCYRACPYGHKMSVMDYSVHEGKCPECHNDYNNTYNSVCHRCRNERSIGGEGRDRYLCGGCSTMLCRTCNRRFKNKADDPECKECAEFTKELRDKKFSKK